MSPHEDTLSSRQSGWAMPFAHKAWKGSVIAKNKDEYEKMEHYARIIRVPT
jgi:hypothetical protein